MSLHGPSSHRRNTSRPTSPSGTVAVSEGGAVAKAAVAVGAVHPGNNATSVPVSSELEGLQPQFVAPSPTVVTVFPYLISPASEPDAPRSKLRAGAIPLTDYDLISVR